MFRGLVICYGMRVLISLSKLDLMPMFSFIARRFSSTACLPLNKISVRWKLSKVCLSELAFVPIYLSD